MFACLYRKKLIINQDILIYKQEYYNLLRKILVLICIDVSKSNTCIITNEIDQIKTEIFLRW